MFHSTRSPPARCAGHTRCDTQQLMCRWVLFDWSISGGGSGGRDQGVRKPRLPSQPYMAGINATWRTRETAFTLIAQVPCYLHSSPLSCSAIPSSSFVCLWRIDMRIRQRRSLEFPSAVQLFKRGFSSRRDKHRQRHLSHSHCSQSERRYLAASGLRERMTNTS